MLLLDAGTGTVRFDQWDPSQRCAFAEFEPPTAKQLVDVGHDTPKR
jgi:hypothetical protein